MENINQVLEHHKAQVTAAQLETYYALHNEFGTRSVNFDIINLCLYLTDEQTGNRYRIYPDGESILVWNLS